MKPKEAAGLLGISVTTVYKLIELKILEAHEYDHVPFFSEKYDISWDQIHRVLIKFNRGKRIPSFQALKSGMLKSGQVRRWLKISKSTMSRYLKDGIIEAVLFPTNSSERQQYGIPRAWIKEKFNIEYLTPLVTPAYAARVSGLSRDIIYDRMERKELTAIRFQPLDKAGWRIIASSLEKGSRRKTLGQSSEQMRRISPLGVQANKKRRYNLKKNKDGRK